MGPYTHTHNAILPSVLWFVNNDSSWTHTECIERVNWAVVAEVHVGKGCKGSTVKP